MSLQTTARSCKALEDEYTRMRQSVGLDTLAKLHSGMADEAVRRHLVQLQSDCAHIGGVFASQVGTRLRQLLEALETQ